ncbi:hypothetical protein [Methanolobus sp. WCC4]|uniref:hypothetical protein n=1 Tax=Methanolobus sp. WCC4 TaxID=3125784 RepID=UPI0030F9DD5D
MGAKGNSFVRDTRGADTIPLKMVFYLLITGAIIFLMAFSWNSLSPVHSGAKDSKQIDDVRVELMSIQNGYARDISDLTGPDGSTCTVELSLPQVSYLAFGVDPDPDMNGNLTDSYWIQENNTIICQYGNGAKDRYHIDGDTIFFRKGTFDNNTGKWIPDSDQDNNRNIGLVLEGPVKGNFDFELIMEDKKYTLSNF